LEGGMAPRQDAPLLYSAYVGLFKSDENTPCPGMSGMDTD